MKLKRLRDDTRGGVIVEFAVTFPFFLALMFGIVQAGLILYTQTGMQHGVEVAARCASVNYAASKIPLNQSCFTDPLTGTPTPSDVIGDPTIIENYAVKNSWGFTPTVVVTNGVVCGAAKGYRVRATYTYNVLNYIFFSVPLTATSCFPTNINVS
jgi:Flp pilus assembly protein TadG